MRVICGAAGGCWAISAAIENNATHTAQRRRRTSLLPRQLHPGAIGHDTEKALVGILADDKRVRLPRLPDLQSLEPLEESIHNRVIEELDVHPLPARRL